jgi:hypothetical protein
MDRCEYWVVRGVGGKVGGGVEGWLGGKVIRG